MPTSTTGQQSTVTIAPPSQSAPPTTLAEEVTFEFRSESGQSDTATFEIFYPVLLHPDAEVETAVNNHIEEWVSEMIAETRAAGDDLAARFSAQLAPELLNESVFSISGVSTEVLSAAAGSVGRRHGWIFDLRTGAAISASELFLDGNLEALAAASRAHLVADVFGDESLLSGPDGLLPVPANFDAVWLTASGLGVGFDEGQVAAPEVGTPTVTIPYEELAPSLDRSGVLDDLDDDWKLPES